MRILYIGYINEIRDHLASPFIASLFEDFATKRIYQLPRSVRVRNIDYVAVNDGILRKARRQVRFLESLAYKLVKGDLAEAIIII